MNFCIEKHRQSQQIDLLVKECEDLSLEKSELNIELRTMAWNNLENEKSISELGNFETFGFFSEILSDNTLEIRLKDCKSLVDQKDSLIAKLHQMKETRQDNLAENDDEIKQLLAHLEECNGKLDEMVCLADKLQNELLQVQETSHSECRAKDEKHNQLKVKFDLISNQMRELKANLDNKDTRAAKLQEDLLQLKEKFRLESLAKDEKDILNAKLQEELVQLKEKLRHESLAKNQLKVELESVSDQLKGSKAKLDGKDALAAKLQEEQALLKEKFRACALAKAQKFRQLKAAFEAVSNQLKESKAKIDDLTAKSQKDQMQLKEKSRIESLARDQKYDQLKFEFEAVSNQLKESKAKFHGKDALAVKLQEELVQLREKFRHESIAKDQNYKQLKFELQTVSNQLKESKVKLHDKDTLAVKLQIAKDQKDQQSEFDFKTFASQVKFSKVDLDKVDGRNVNLKNCLQKEDLHLHIQNNGKRKLTRNQRKKNAAEGEFRSL